MKVVFTFFLRLFFCFLAGKLLLLATGFDKRGYLIALTLLLLANVYFFDYLEYRDHFFRRRPREEPQDLPSPQPEGASPPVSPPEA